MERPMQRAWLPWSATLLLLVLSACQARPAQSAEGARKVEWSYSLAQFHLHSPSKHTVDGQHAALESSPPQERAGDGSEELAKKLSNPVASLISVPFQLNHDQDIGPVQDGERTFLNFQPVVPIALSDEWNVISRTIVPITFEQDDVFPGAGDQSGLGDVLQSLFFSPKEPTARGLIWGVGPVVLLPTGTDELLTADQWAVGPTAVALEQSGPWTYGLLANHLWGVHERGSEDRTDVSSSFVQPFVSYTTPNAWTYALNAESTYDWRGEDWAVPLNAVVSKLVVFGRQPVSLGCGLRYWAEHAENGPEGLGLRFVVTPLFPK
jgi:hypothetical protein